MLLTMCPLYVTIIKPDSGARTNMTDITVLLLVSDLPLHPPPSPQARLDSYWQGDWVCKDCGYVYNRDECAGFYFEEQGAGFRCPQCSGPRRRYAKKVGDVVGTTLDGGGKEV